MCCKATHAAEKVSSWLQSTADCGSGRMSQLFRFFFVFLGLRIFTRIYCIWSETREQNLNDLLSYNGPQFLIKNRFTYPNDLKQPLFVLFLICSLLFDLSSTGLIKKRGTQCFSSRKREPCTNDLHQPQFLIKHRCTYPNDLKQPLFLLFLICSLLFDLSSTGLIKKRGTQCFISSKGEPYPYQAQGWGTFESQTFESRARVPDLWVLNFTVPDIRVLNFSVQDLSVLWVLWTFQSRTLQTWTFESKTFQTWTFESQTFETWTFESQTFQSEGQSELLSSRPLSPEHLSPESLSPDYLIPELLSPERLSPEPLSLTPKRPKFSFE